MTEKRTNNRRAATRGARTLGALSALLILGLTSLSVCGQGDRNALLNWIDNVGSLEPLNELVVDFDHEEQGGVFLATFLEDMFGALRERGLDLDETTHQIMFINFEQASGGEQSFGQILDPFGVPPGKRIGREAILLAVSELAQDVYRTLGIVIRPFYPGARVTGDDYTERITELVWYADGGDRNIDLLVRSFVNTASDVQAPFWEDVFIDPFGAIYFHLELALPESLKLTPIDATGAGVVEGAIEYSSIPEPSVQIEPLAIGAVSPESGKYGVFIRRIVPVPSEEDDA